MSIIGHNSPPSSIDFAKETGEALGVWLKENPVIQTEDEARAAKLLVDRAKNSLGEMESERDKQVRPLNEQVKAINDTYRGPRETLERITELLLERLEAYAKAEKAKREKEAEEKRRIAQEAETEARKAEAREQEAKAEAQAGILDIDIATLTTTADDQFSRFQQATREAARAEKATKVKIGGGFGRALGLRQTEVLVIKDAHAAIMEMGLTDDLKTAILTAARAYRKVSGDLPEGIIATTQEGL